MDDSDAPTSEPPAPGLAGAFARAAIAGNEHAAQLGDKRLTDWLEAFEAEHVGVTKALLEAALNSPMMPAEVRTALEGVVAPGHQTQVILGLFAVGNIVSTFVGAAIAPLTQEVSNTTWQHRPSMPLSPAEVALAAVKGIMTSSDAAAEALMSGVDGQRYDVIERNTGDAPAPQVLMEALRRQVIDTARFEHGIRQGRSRNEWIDVYEALRFAPPPVGEVLAAAVQNHLAPDDARNKISEAGINPDNYDWLYETHGRPPGIFELGELLHRGEITQAVLEQAIRESDIKNKYIPAIVALTRKIPPMRSVVSAVRQGVLSSDDGLTKLMELGYDHADAAMFVSEAKATKHQGTRDLTEGQILDLYTEHLISADVAKSMLTKLGFDSEEVGWVMALADHKRHYRFQVSAINHIHTKYVARKVDKASASAALDKLGIDPAGRDDLLTLWAQELDTITPQLSLSQLQGAVRRKLITPSDFGSRCLKLGWEMSDLDILYAEAFPPTHVPDKVHWQ